MFSKEFMSYLIKYNSEENEANKVNTKKEISFKNNYKSRLAKVYVSINR